MNLPKIGWIIMLGFCISLVSAADRVSDRLRLGDVTYLEDYTDKTVDLKALMTTPLTVGRDGSSILDSIQKGQSVQIIGFDQGHYLIRARIANGRGEGWVLANDFEPFPEPIWQEMQKKSVQVEKIKQAIARNEVEIGMPQEAVAKILGKPKSKSSITEAGGSFEQWTYTTYKTVPYYTQTPGFTQTTVNGTNTTSSGYYTSTMYRKVPKGSKVVTFQDKKVIRFETKEDDVTPYQTGQTVVPPGYVIP